MGIIYALLGAVFLALLTFSSKIFANKSKNPLIISGIFQIMVSVVFLILIFFEEPKFLLDWKYILLIVVAILFYIFANIFGFLSYKHIDVSICGIVDQLSLVFSFIGAIIIFNETNSLFKILGVTLIIFGNFIVIQKVGKSKNLMKGILLRFGFVLGGTVGTLIDSHIMTYGLVSLFLYSFLVWFFPGVGVTLIAFKYSSKEEIIEDIKSNWKGMMMMAFFGVIATIVILLAYSKGEKSIVFPIVRLSSIILVILGAIFLKERKHLQSKVLAVVIVFLGIYLMSR